MDVLHSRNIEFAAFEDYQTFLDDAFQAIYKEHGQKLPDGSCTKVTLEDNETLFTFVSVRSAIDMKTIRAFMRDTLHKSYGFRVNESSQKNFLQKIVHRYVKDAKRKLERFTHVAIGQHFSCSGKGEPPTEFREKWPDYEKKDVRVNYLGKSLTGTLFLGGIPCKKSQSSPRKKKGPKKQKEEDSASVTSKPGGSSKESSMQQKEVPKNPTEEDGASAEEPKEDDDANVSSKKGEAQSSSRKLRDSTAQQKKAPVTKKRKEDA